MYLFITICNAISLELQISDQQHVYKDEHRLLHKKISYSMQRSFLFVAESRIEAMWMDSNAIFFTFTQDDVHLTKNIYMQAPELAAEN